MNDTKNIHENGEDGKLRDLAGNKMPYEVPDGYFDELPGKVLESIKKQATPSLLQRSGFRKFVAAAAIFIFAALIINMVFTNRNTDSDSYSEFSMSQIYEYNINNLADIEDTYLMSLIEDESIATIDLMGEDTLEVSDNIIIEYLLAENHIEYRIINE